MTDKLQHHELTAEWLDDDQGRAIMLTQADGSGCNEAATILLSPWQLRAVCERFDLVGTSDPKAAKTIATLTRRLLVLNGRIEHLADYLHNNSDATLYPPDDAVKNLIRMSGYMDKKLASISANRVVDLSLLDELGTKRNQRSQK